MILHLKTASYTRSQSDHFNIFTHSLKRNRLKFLVIFREYRSNIYDVRVGLRSDRAIRHQKQSLGLMIERFYPDLVFFCSNH